MLTLEEFTALHARSRSGDTAAVNELVGHFRRFARKLAAGQTLVDPDTAESIAMEAVWQAAVKVERPNAVLAYARQRFRWKVRNEHRDRKSWAAHTDHDWSRVCADSVRFPCDLAGGPPCVVCGTTEGHIRKDRVQPTRVKGRCSACNVRAWKQRNTA